MNINLYLAREISKPFAAILLILCALFGGYAVASILADAVNGLLPAGTIAALAALKLLIALDVLTPISLYFAVIMSFGRLYGDSEILAMAALGVTPWRVLYAVFRLAAAVALAVALVSLAARPWAYHAAHLISQRAALSLNVNAMEAGTFYASDDGARVIFLNRRAGPGTPAQGVFVRRDLGDHQEVIYAQNAVQDGRHQVYLANAHIYEIYPFAPQNDQILNVQGVTLSTNSTFGMSPDTSPVAASSRALLRDPSPKNIAELQWRLSTPISTLLLALLGVPLARTQPRQGRYARIGRAILLYAGYYLLCTSARTWVEHGTVGTIPGLWWAPALLALCLAASLYAPRFSRKRAGRRRAGRVPFQARSPDVA